jgi:hypothetical protein
MSDSISTRWCVYESSVQQYRILSATVPSFLLTVAAIWANPPAARGVPLLVGMASLGLLHIFAIWLPILEARVLIVDYYKGQLELGPELRATRKKLDRWVPLGYAVIWIGLVVWYVGSTPGAVFVAPAPR